MPPELQLKVSVRDINRFYRGSICESTFKTINLKRDVPDIGSFCTQLREQTAEDARKIFKRLMNIKQMVENLQCKLAEQKYSKQTMSFTKPGFDLLKENVLSIEEALSDYHNEEQNAMRSLIKCESNLWQECTNFAERIELWESSPKHINPLTKCTSLRGHKLSKCETLLPEVFAFQEYLAKHGGRTGGWQDSDHQTFIKIRRRYLHSHLKKSNVCSDWTIPDNLRQQFLQEIASALYLDSQREAAAHEKWFSKLQQLEAASRRAIREYKLTQATSSSRGCSEPEKTPKSSISPNRLQQRAKLDEWRKAKQLEVEEKLAADRKALAEQKRMNELKRVKRLEELKSQLANFRSRREALDAVQAEKQSLHRTIKQKSRKLLTKLDKARIQGRTDYLLRLQLARRRAVSRTKEERECRVKRAYSKLGPRADRNPDRAIGYTELWKIRVQALKDKDKLSQPQLPLTHLVVERRMKAVPEWRKQIFTR